MSTSNTRQEPTGISSADSEARKSGKKLAAVFLLIAALLAVVGCLHLSTQQKKAKLQAHRELSAIADLKLRQISQWRNERIADAYFFTHARFAARDLQSLLQDPKSEATRSMVLDWLKLLKGGDRYYGIAVFDPAARFQIGFLPARNEADAHLKDLFEQARKAHNIVVTDLALERSSGLIYLDLVCPIFENADWSKTDPICYVLLRVDARQFLFPVIQSWPTRSETAEALLVRREGDSVVFLNDLRNRTGTALQLKMPMLKPDLPAVRVLNGETEVLEGEDYRGKSVVAAGRRIPETTWAMVAKVDRDEIYKPLRQHNLTAMAMLGTLLIASAFLVALLWRERTATFLKQELADRVHHEKEMERVNRLYAALTLVNKAVVRAKSETDLLQKICDALVQAGGCDMAWVGRIEPATTRIMPIAQSGDSGGYLRQVDFFGDGSPGPSEFMHFPIRKGHHYICNDLTACPEAPVPDSQKPFAGWQSLAAFPILREGIVGGVLTVYSNQKNFFGPQERDLIEEAADDVSFGLDTLINRDRRRDAERALREGEEQLRVAAMAGEVGMWSWIPGTNEVMVSANWRLLFNVDSQEPVTYEMWRRALHPDDRDRAARELHEAAAQHRNFKTEYRVIRPDGSIRWIVDRGKALYDGDGKPVKVAGVNTDITERKLAEEFLLQARDELAQVNADLERTVAKRTAQLVEANASLQAFAYTAAHDLRTPLRSIRSFTNLTLEDFSEVLGTEGRDMLHRADTSAAQMERLLNDLLEYSRMSQAELHLKPVNLAEAISDAMSLLHADIEAKRPIIRIAESLPKVLGHAATVSLVISNLVSNSLKFTPASVKPEINIWAEKVDSSVKVWVQDNGIGIAPENLERIFAPFERLHSKSVYPGTGLGLAIVRKGAERMGGRVGVESEPGKGSRFWVELSAA